MLKTILKLGWVALLIIAGADAAFACSCGGPGASCANRVSTVFVGKIKSFEPADPTSNNIMGRTAVTFEVSESLRGNFSKTIVVVANIGGGEDSLFSGFTVAPDKQRTHFSAGSAARR